MLSVLSLYCVWIIEDFSRLTEGYSVVGKILNSLLIIPLKSHIRLLSKTLLRNFYLFTSRRTNSNKSTPGRRGYAPSSVPESMKS